MFGPHMQLPVNNWLEMVERLPANTPVKSVNDGGLLVEAKRANAGVFTILRHWYDPQQVFGGDYEQNRQRARQFFDAFIDDTFFAQYAPHIDAIEEFNEYFDSRHVPLQQRQWLKDNYGIGFNPEFLEQEYQQRLTWIRAANDVWTHEYRSVPRLEHIRLVTGNVPIGNDIPLEYARIVEQHRGLLSYHAYIHVRDGSVVSGDDLYHSGRYKYNDEYFKLHGVHVDWISTEGGPFANVLDGWKHPGVCDGDIECYKEALRTFATNAEQWNNANHNRFRGTTLFTTIRHNDPQWKHYHIEQPHLNEVATVSQAFPIPDRDTPPPTPVWNKLVYLLPQDTTVAEYDQIQVIAYATRSEIAFSANSAFSRPDDVGQHKVIMYAVDRWGGQTAIENWLAEQGYIYSPATVIEYRDFEQGFELIPDVSEWQSDINWAKLKNKLEEESA